jgi:hypothetical protein
MNGGSFLLRWLNNLRQVGVWTAALDGQVPYSSFCEERHAKPVNRAIR